MPSCPSDEQLVCLLDEQLDRADEDRIVVHVETCSRCQARLDELVRNRLPNPAWLPSPPAEIAVQDGAAPQTRRLEDGAGTVDPADSPPAAPADVTVDLAPSVELPATSDPTPTETEEMGGPLGRTVVDSPASPEHPPAVDALRRPMPDAQVATDVSPPNDVIPPKPTAPIAAAPLDLDRARVTCDVHGPNGDGTMTHSGPAAGPPLASRDPSRTEGPRIPGYDLLEKLGQGGMGVVYKARQQGLNRLVALKMIIGGRQARVDHLARFRIEAEAVARLRHPNILQIYDIGEIDGLPFVALELLEGGDLDDRLAGTPQPGNSGAELVATLARAVHAAHQAGIIHRDLKPTNILFTSDSVPKITDFGLAKRLESDSRQTETGEIMGSPSYMAPEQARGHTKDVGPAADIYALGAILYEVLTGRPPFKGETAMETLRQVTDDDPVPPSRLVPRVGRDLETICLKCLHKDPHKRYVSAQALADDLERCFRGEPIQARRTPLHERAIKWARRRPVAAMFLVLGLMAFLGLTVGGAGYERRARFRLVQLDAQFFQDQTRGMAFSDQADRASTRGELEQAQRDLGSFHPDVAVDPRLQPIWERIDAKRRSVDKRLQVLDALDAARERDRADRGRYQKFLERRQEAQLYAAVTGTLLSADRPQKLHASAHEALAIYAQDPQAADDAWALADPLPSALSELEKIRVRDGCYDLLLIRSQAAGPAEDPAESLRILDRALRLRPQATAAYHLRRADCLERAGDAAGRDREQQAAQQLPPVTPLDYFLSGRELAARGRFDDAIRLLDTAVQRDLDQTSAHLLLAVCYLNKRPKQLSAARTSLIACIRSHPDVVGLYLLRASIFGEEGSQGAGKQAADAFESAEGDYRDVLKRPLNDDVRYSVLASRGLLRLRSGRLDDAVADLEAAIRLKPGQYQAHTTLGQVRQGQGRPDEAHAAFSRAIDCHPEPNVLAGLYRTRALIPPRAATSRRTRTLQRSATSRRPSATSRTRPRRRATTSGVPVSSSLAGSPRQRWRPATPR
jgi:tetratricopeptide (TPR) repeat protein/tRNA A-37 threonylcarbamoyl transferase component Bud32